MYNIEISINILGSAYISQVFDFWQMYIYKDLQSNKKALNEIKAE